MVKAPEVCLVHRVFRSCILCLRPHCNLILGCCINQCTVKNALHYFMISQSMAGPSDWAEEDKEAGLEIE